MACLETERLRMAGLPWDVTMFCSSGRYQHQQSPLSASSAEEEASSEAEDLSGLLWEDFSVDDLLDFGGGKEQAGGEEEGFLQVEEAEEERDRAGWSNSNTTTSYSSSSSFLSFQEAPPPSDLIVPARDVEELEWVSRFVDDSYSEFTAAAVTLPLANDHALAPPASTVAAKAEAPEAHSTRSSNPLKRTWQSCSSSTESVVVPGKARSKRSRTGGRVWSLCRPPLLSRHPSSSCSSASSSSACSGSSTATSCLLLDNLGGGRNPDCILYCLGGGASLNQHQPPQLPVKKKKGRKPKASAESATSAGGTSGAEPRARQRCLHCGVDKTPQWRAGPMGPKTLCNACGVRYKSGRLLPEYRPAASPTFLGHVHSNSHRKVLEMRRNKELLAGDGYCSPSPRPLGTPTTPYGVP